MSKTAVAFLLAVLCGSAVASSSTARAVRLHEELINKKVLVGTVLTWEGTEYDVSKSYVICDAYEGICFKGYQAGFNDPLMLAVSESARGELAVQPVDYIKFKRERSAEAIAHYKTTLKLDEERVFQLKDLKGQELFDAMGNLTKPGELVYESELEGKTGIKAPTKKQLREEKARKEREARKGKKKVKGTSNTGFSKLPVKRLIEMGYKEIYLSELDCIHSIPFNDSDLIMEKVDQEGRTRYFMNPKDPAFNVAMKYRKEKLCAPYGKGQFTGRE